MWRRPLQVDDLLFARLESVSGGSSVLKAEGASAHVYVNGSGIVEPDRGPAGSGEWRLFLFFFHWLRTEHLLAHPRPEPLRLVLFVNFFSLHSLNSPPASLFCGRS